MSENSKRELNSSESKEGDMKSDFFADELLAELESASPLESAYHAQDRSADVGFDFASMDLVLDRVKDEYREMGEAYEKRDEDFEHFKEELGDCFFALVNLSRHAGIDPDALLRENVAKYLRRCQRIEEGLKSEGKRWSDLPLEEIYRRWKQVKKEGL